MIKNNSTTPVVRNLRTGKITIDHSLVKQIMYFVDKVPTECQWFHLVEQRPQDDGTMDYHIYDMIIPHQIVTGATVHSSPKTFMTLSQEIADRFESKRMDPGYNETMRLMNCWCHSHVMMGVGPSGTDDGNFKEQIERAAQAKNAKDQLMMIFNKRGEVFTRVYQASTGLLIENVPVSVINVEVPQYPYIDEAILTKLEKPTVTDTKSNIKNWLPKHHTDFDKETQKEISFPNQKKNHMSGSQGLRKNSEETKTVGSSSDSYGLEELTAAQIKLLQDSVDDLDLQDTDSEEYTRALSYLGKTLKGAFSPLVLAITYSLLFQDQSESLVEAESWAKLKADHYYASGLGDLLVGLQSTALDQADLLLVALAYAKRIAQCHNESSVAYITKEFFRKEMWEIDDESA